MLPSLGAVLVLSWMSQNKAWVPVAFIVLRVATRPLLVLFYSNSLIVYYFGLARVKLKGPEAFEAKKYQIGDASTAFGWLDEP